MEPVALRPRGRIVGRTQGGWDLGGRSLTPLRSEPTLVLRGCDSVPERDRLLPGGLARNPAPTDIQPPRHPYYPDVVPLKRGAQEDSLPAPR